MRNSKTLLFIAVGLASVLCCSPMASAQQSGTLALLPFDCTQASVSPGNTTTVNITVDTDAKGGDILDIVLTDPSVSVALSNSAGLNVTAGTALNNAIQWTTMNVSGTPLPIPTFLNTPGVHNVIELPSGSPGGQYQVIADATQSTTSSTVLVYYVSSSTVGVAATASPATVSIGSPVTISAIALDGSSPILAANSTATLVPTVDVSAQVRVSTYTLINTQTDATQNTTTDTYAVTLNNSGPALTGAAAQLALGNLPTGIHVSNSILQIGSMTAQADIVAHSMGGTITRTLEYLPGFTGWESFGSGNIHKLITIGTPHLGSPLAIQLLQASNTCIRNILADKGNIAFYSAQISDSTQSGGIGDLQGDGAGGSLSPALENIQNSNGHEVPTALISGIMSPDNLSGLSWSIAATYLRYKCSSDPLAQSLTAQAWPNIFGQDSDGIVPLKSQLNNLLGAGINGVVHSKGVESLGFNGPSELDPDKDRHIPSTVIQLLNLPSTSGAFRKLP